MTLSPSWSCQCYSRTVPTCLRLITINDFVDMLRFSIVILHALTVLAQGSIPDYFYKDEGDERLDTETMLKYDGVEDSEQGGKPIAYLYMAKNSSPPAKKQCITCLYELHNTGRGLADACNCLPCWIQMSNNDATQKFVVEVFEKRSCSSGVRHEYRDDRNKEVMDEEIDSLLRKQRRRKSKTEKNVNHVKYFEDYLQYPERPAKRNKSIALKSRLTPDDSITCAGEDCGDEETIKAENDESYKVVKEKVKKVFKDVFSKMARINEAAEDADEAETSKDTTGMYRAQRNRASEERPKLKASKSYENHYRRPSFRVALPPKQPDNSNRRKSENKDDIASDEGDAEIMPIGARREDLKMESKISKSFKSKDRKSMAEGEARRDDVPEAIPDDISIGSLTFKDPFGDGEEVEDYEDQLHEDEFTVKHSTKDSSEGDVRDYTINYDDDASQEKNRKSEEATEDYQETRNTPSYEDLSKTTETPYRSKGKVTTARSLRKTKSRLRASKLGKTTEKPNLKVSSDEYGSFTSSDEGDSSTERSGKRLSRQEGALATTKGSRSGQTEMTTDNSTPTSEESTTASSRGLILRFTDVSRSANWTATSEESTESTATSESPETVQTPYDSSSESVTSRTTTPTESSSESSKTTFQFRSTRKYTRSVKETATTDKRRGSDDSEERTTGVTESTKSERFLRQTNGNDFKSETTEPDDSPKLRMINDSRNATQSENPRYVIELEDESDSSSGKTRNPDEPIIKVKVNIFTNSGAGNVYNFLSKLLPKDGNSADDDRGSKKGLQIETSFRNDRPKTLSVRNVDNPKRRGR